MKKQENYEIMHRNPNNWKGIFYVNSKDSRIIVPKLYPMLGWTLNFGNKYPYISIIAIVLIIIASQYIL